MAKRHAFIRTFRINHCLIRETLAEFLSTFVFTLIGELIRASLILNHQSSDALITSIGSGIAVSFGIYISGGISGGFINPCISFAWAAMGRMGWICCVCYCLAEYFGAFVASASVHAIYYDALQNYTGNQLSVFDSNGTAALFATYPPAHQSLRGAVINEIAASTLMMVVVCAQCDARNFKPENGLFPLVSGLLFTALVLCFNCNGGASLNPARDFSPRLYSLLAGWGTETFSIWDYNWFWIPAFMPYAGALFGTLIYQVFIEIHWSPEISEELIELATCGQIDVKDDKLGRLDDTCLVDTKHRYHVSRSRAQSLNLYRVNTSDSLVPFAARTHQHVL